MNIRDYPTLHLYTHDW